MVTVDLKAELLQMVSCHHSGQDNAGYKTCGRCQQSAGQCVAGFCDFGGHKVYAHGIKDGFRTGHRDRGNQSQIRVRSIFFENIQKKPCGCRGGEHFHKGKRDKGAGKSDVCGKMSDNPGDKV